MRISSLVVCVVFAVLSTSCATMKKKPGEDGKKWKKVITKRVEVNRRILDYLAESEPKLEEEIKRKWTGYHFRNASIDHVKKLVAYSVKYRIYLNCSITECPELETQKNCGKDKKDGKVKCVVTAFEQPLKKSGVNSKTTVHCFKKSKRD